ncbi:hypothetical protein Thiowin_01955 [Thiorhodovibrio winogradskyi]|uniref:Tetratricopeptide repeat protein n=1 Tax=Thiorhodovibrio winogradskyi TaxID=77007 RepID=A0ABZ0S7K6_9GAMM|nr:hypothetical protein [Thiorhodovibrio winogradskyi]
MNETEVLTEANRLVAIGFRHAAIDLLRECLKSRPDSPSLNSSLGRIYRLVGQPGQAVVHLKRALEVRQNKNQAPHLSPNGHDDDFTDDDLAFVTAQAEQHNEIETLPYDFLSTENSQIKLSDAPQTLPNPVLRNATRNKGYKAGKPNKSETKVEYRGQHRSRPQDNSAPQVQKAEIDRPEDTRSVLTSPIPESPPEEGPFSRERRIRQTPPPELHTAIRQERLIGPYQATVRYPLGEASLHNDKLTEYQLDSATADEPPSELLSDEIAADCGFEESDGDEDDICNICEPFATISDEEETDALFWVDTDDLDEFDDQARPYDNEPPTINDFVTRAMRARQVAVEVLMECDWPSSAVDLLQQVFMENGWSATRVAVEREIDKGLLPQELELAMDLRHFWLESPCFWTTYQWIKSNTPCMYSAAAYRHISWAQALRIVRCFPAIPDVEEIIILIEDSYDRWYSDDELRRIFKSFLEFLKYRTGSMPRTLPGQCFFGFLPYWEDD